MLGFWVVARLWDSEGGRIERTRHPEAWHGGLKNDIVGTLTDLLAYSNENRHPVINVIT